MKKTKKILAIAVILMLILGSLTFVKAETDKLVISDGVQSGNTVTFTLTIPQAGGLNGDANDNGRVDEYADYDDQDEEYNVDAYLILKYCAMVVTEDQLNVLLADWNLDGTVSVADVVGMNNERDLLTNPIKLNGTLAEDSTYKMSKNSDGTYKVVVTLPQNTNGTIGITVKERVFKYNQTTANEEMSSNLLNVSTQGMTGATEPSITISDGVKEGNKITFKINAPNDTTLRGDVDLNGKIEQADAELINKYILNPTGNSLTGIQLKAADAEVDGVINTSDSQKLVNYIEGAEKYEPVTLNGTLADSSEYELVKDSNGNYSIVVTIPDGTIEGTIGVTVESQTFMFDLGSANKATSSELFDLSKLEDGDNTDALKVIEQKDEKQDDGKIKVTVIVNKELDKDKIPNGWTLSEDGKSITKIMNKGEKEEIELVAKDGSKTKYTVIAGSTLKDDENKNDQSKDDGTTSNKIIPQTGATSTILVVIAGIAIVGIIAFFKYIKNIKIK